MVGGGAAGLTAAYFAAQAGARVTILERNGECGKKILVRALRQETSRWCLLALAHALTRFTARRCLAALAPTSCRFLWT